MYIFDILIYTYIYIYILIIIDISYSYLLEFKIVVFISVYSIIFLSLDDVSKLYSPLASDWAGIKNITFSYPVNKPQQVNHPKALGVDHGIAYTQYISIPQIGI